MGRQRKYPQEVSIAFAPVAPSPARKRLDFSRPYNEGTRGTIPLYTQDGQLFKIDGEPFEEDKGNG